MKRETCAALAATRRIVVLLTVWVMALAGVLASVAVLPSSASAALPTARAGVGSVVARDAAGSLWLYPVNGAGVFQARRQIGSGWNIMTALVTPGDVTGDGNTDVLARDRAGRLWLYPGTSTGHLSSRRQIGAGWQSYTISSAGNLNGVGRPDLLARDKAGVLWLYPFSGNAAFGRRVKVGSGWNKFTLVGPGDVSGDGRADILARYTTGTLWLYRGTGTGGVLKGTLVSRGWQRMTDFVGPGNWDRLLGNDLLTRDGDGHLWLYSGNNAGGFGRARQISSGWGGMTYLGWSSNTTPTLAGGGSTDVIAPGPVTGLGATVAGDTSIKLDWSNPTATDFTGVTIRRALGATAPATATDGTSVPAPASATTTSYTDTTLAAGTQYSYAVFAHDGSGNQAVAAKVSATTTTPTGGGTTDTTPPGPVTALAATVASGTSIKLDWTNPTAADYTGVTIRRAPGATAPGTVTDGTSVPAPASATATTSTDTGLAAGTQYSYAVFAHDGSGNNAAAANVTATTTTIVVPPDTTAPGPVTALAATVASGTSIKLDWTNPTAADYTGVTIRRALGATAPATATSGTSVPAPASATATTSTDTGLTAGTQYSYAVFAHDGSGNNAAAANVTATTTTTTINPPTAVLAVNSSVGLTAKTSVGGYTALFDVSSSKAGSGETLVSAVLDYGDGTAPKSFSGDPATWFADHGYTSVGVKAVTVVVTDSAGATATDAVTVTVYPSPTATIKVVGPVVLDQPVMFDVTTLTAAGTVFTDYMLSYDGVTWENPSGAAPTPLTHTFSAEGTYTVSLHVYNDADGYALTSTTVRVDATAPGPLTALTAVPGADSMALAWTNPTDADFGGVTIRRLAGVTAPTLTTGTLVTDTAKDATSFTDAPLTLGTQYSYAAFAHDGSGNYAAPANATGTTLASRPTAVLSINGSTSATAKTSVGGFRPLFDVSGSQAGVGTLVSAKLDYGDGTTQTFTGPDTTIWFADHVYFTSGDMAVTVLVTNSAGDTATAAVLVTVFGSPAARVTPPRIARPNEPVVLALTSSTPAGTVFTDYDVSYDNGVTWERLNGVPPTALTHTFSAEATYIVLLNVYNDADGYVLTSTPVRVDVTPPAPVTNPVVALISSGDTFLSLSWTNPTDADFTGVTIRRSPGPIAPATVTDGDPVADLIDSVPYVVDAGLTPGTQYSYAVFAHDGSGNYAAGVNVTGTTTGTAPHLVPPGPVATLTAAAVSDTSIKLDWANPNDVDFAGVTIRRAEGATAPASATTGVSVTVPASTTATSFTDIGLTAGTQYSYSVFAYDVANNHAAGANATATTTQTTTAGLLVYSKVTVGTEVFFDPATSYAATGATLTGTLEYGDGTSDSFSGDPINWAGFHTYDAAGAKTVTLTVIDSANKVVTKVLTIEAYDPPTASMPATATATVGVPFTFPFTATTPAGTVWQGWSLYGDWLAGGHGTAAPASTHTFLVAGTYPFTLTVTNDAQGDVTSSPMVVTVQ